MPEIEIPSDEYIVEQYHSLTSDGFISRQIMCLFIARRWLKLNHREPGGPLFDDLAIRCYHRLKVLYP